MIILVFGLPASGKTYFSHRLHLALNAKHLNTDKVRKEMKKQGEYDEQTKQLIYDALIEKARLSLQRGDDVIIDGTFHKASRREMVSRLARETGHNPVCIHIKASEETIRKRLKANRELSEANFEVYRKLKNTFETMPEKHLTLWSDEEPVHKMITKAKKTIYEHRTNS